MNAIQIKCPVCENGNMKENESNYRCDHFKTADDKCDFTIWKEFYGKYLLPETVDKLCKNKKTDFIDGFTTKEGKIFSSSLIINEHNKVAFQNEKPTDINCLSCGGKILETSFYYKCEHNFTQTCQISVPKVIAKKTLKEETIISLLNGETTDFIDGFISNDGNEFSSRLFIDDNDFKVKFDSSINKCPKCQIGNIREFEKSYSCSNYKSENPCDFSVWKSQNGGNVSRKNIIELCSDNQTKPISFKTKDNTPYKGFLKIDSDFKVSLEKI